MCLSLVILIHCSTLIHGSELQLPLYQLGKSLLIVYYALGHPLQCSCLENPRDGGAWWAAVYGVTQSQTRLK